MVPENTYIDEKEEVPKDEGHEWVRTGQALVYSGRLNLSGQAKIFLLTTPAKTFEDFTNEIKAKMWWEEIKKIDAVNGFGRVVTTYTNRMAGDLETSLYIFIEPGKYLEFTNATKFIIDSLEIESLYPPPVLLNSP